MSREIDPAKRESLSVARVVLTSLLFFLPACVAFGASDPTPKASPSRGFAEFVASLRPMAEALGVSRKTFDRAFAGVAFDPRVVAETKRQAEFTVPIWDYIAAAASPDRIARGRAKVAAVAPWLDRASRTYGVDPGVLVGVWGLETDYGAAGGTFDVVRSLASLAFVRYRDTFFRDELLAALVVLNAGAVAPRALVGSWAGATGQTQFMPSNVVSFAVDFDGDGRRDLWKSLPDVFASTANFLASSGWKAGLPWGFAIALPKGFVLADADSARPAPFAAFAARGVARADGRPFPAEGEARLFLPAGLRGPAFLVTANFDVIKTYNASTAYALAVALLGDAVVNSAPVPDSWPRTDGALSAAQVRALQTGLKAMGYDPGAIDGMIGDALRAAVRKYQEKNGLTPDGYADVALLNRIASGR